MLRPWALVITVLLLPTAAEAADDVQAINLSAVEQHWVGDTWRGVGDVLILYQDIKVRCDEIEYNRVTRDLVARGSVILDQGPSRFTADELHFNLGTKTGIFYNRPSLRRPHVHLFRTRDREAG